MHLKIKYFRKEIRVSTDSAKYQEILKKYLDFFKSKKFSWR